ncbi:uncharacterized protein PSFLO_04917 [Pseudozyma flocculosa]|uniref:Uncharacterized protein n=1 Tax=Pseudozyma flocculosa TaxID=84751 RepID=A0A5C3F616_9BASI|nr:uncharacterized protein PSFLO_04917 [Pseudozyma flocculosa]
MRFLAMLPLLLVLLCSESASQPVHRARTHRQAKRVQPTPPNSIEVAGLIATVLGIPGTLDPPPPPPPPYPHPHPRLRVKSWAIFGPSLIYNYMNARGHNEALIQAAYYRQQRQLLNDHEKLLRDKQLAKLDPPPASAPLLPSSPSSSSSSLPSSSSLSWSSSSGLTSMPTDTQATSVSTSGSSPGVVPGAATGGAASTFNQAAAGTGTGTGSGAGAGVAGGAAQVGGVVADAGAGGAGAAANAPSSGQGAGNAVAPAAVST